MNNDFFDLIFNKYSNIYINNVNKKIYNINTIVYYLADELNSKISAKNVYEVDIHAAFPTICQHIFYNDKNFLNKLNNLSEKKEKNIFISTSLKDTGYLQQLNIISKMIITSCVLDANPEGCEIYELKKDGIIYSGNSITNSKIYEYYTSQLNFSIKEINYNEYIRYNKTSYYISDNEIIIKGVYKDRPKFIQESIYNYFFLNQLDSDLLNKIYSNNYFNIIRYNNLDEVFFKYYICNNNKYLNNDFKYDKIKNIKQCYNILPKNYLKLFVYPLLYN